MTQFPQQPLNNEERTLVAQLPRLRGRIEPDAALDARILAAAHAATQPTSQPSPRRRWTTPVALAASLCLALGLAWRLQHAPPQPNTFQAPAAAPSAQPSAAIAPATTASEAAPAQAKLSAPATALPSPPRTPSSIVSAPLNPPVPIPTPVTVEAPSETYPAPAPPPPPPMPAPAAPTTNADAATSRALAAMPASEATQGKLQTATRAETADAPMDDVPPATMNSPTAREAWLNRVATLLRAGRIDEARASLVEFHRRYPDARLPEELRSLLPSPTAPHPTEPQR